MFRGAMTALVTPFKNGKVDEQAYQDLIEWQIEEGINGLVPCGTTGEAATLSHEEHMRVITLCVEATAGRVPVVAGAGSNSTAEAVRLTKHAKDCGADAVLTVVPYYNKPSSEGLYQHFKSIHDAADIPLVLYNVPGRTARDMDVATIARLSKLKNIVAIKDATADLERPLATRLAAEDDFLQLSGDDGTTIPFLAQGGHGCISVTGNIAPGLLAGQVKAWLEKDVTTLTEIRDRLFPVHKAMFVESNPVPVKYALSLMKGFEPNVRLPLVELTDESKKIVEAALKEADLL